jgi:branched-subunit amino acid aminotransferase/4-amino-4-deoxychorismate lyase
MSIFAMSAPAAPEAAAGAAAGAADASRNSIFVEVGGGLVTPLVAAGALPGVLRAALIAEGRAVEGEVGLADLQRAERWFIGNSLNGLRMASLTWCRADALAARRRMGSLTTR